MKTNVKKEAWFEDKERNNKASVEEKEKNNDSSMNYKNKNYNDKDCASVKEKISVQVK